MQVLWGRLIVLTYLMFAIPVHAQTFPPNFKWCVSTAAHQIEGDNFDSDWWQWEHEPGRIKTGEISGKATDSWTRWHEDLQLVKNLNAGVYRFSVEWAKIEPSPGHFDEEALAHYREQIRTMREMGLEPMVTLHHFVNPAWFANQGGWAWAGAPAAFEKYVRKVVESLGYEARDYVTFNEPTVLLVAGYVDGAFPPGLKGDMAAVVPPMRGIFRAHALAYRAIHELSPRSRVGIAHHLRVFDPKNYWNPLDQLATRIVDRAFNWDFIDAVESGWMRMKIPYTIEVNEKIEGLAGTQDFLGVNYYTRDIVAFDLNSPFKMTLSSNPAAAHSDLGWEIYPEGFARTLRAAAAHGHGKEIIVTENGIADDADVQRAEFLRTHLAAMLGVIAEGVRVNGYCHWSLLDNFEWAEGFKPSFGLYATDRVTHDRTLRPSGALFSRIAGANRL